MPVDDPHGADPARDPVCGRVTADDALTSEHEGRQYRFCSQECKARFDVAPSIFAWTGQAPPAEAWEW